VHSYSRGAARLFLDTAVIQLQGGSMPLKITDLHSLMVHELKDLYNAEHQLLEALPKMASAANDAQLAQAFRDHLAETKGHVKRLETVFAGLEFEPGGQHCKAMEGLLKEGSAMIEEDAPADVKDAGLICAAQRVEHYEMAGYGCARTFARRLGMKDIADLLQLTLDEEGAADKKLTKLAMTKINDGAVNG